MRFFNWRALVLVAVATVACTESPVQSPPEAMSPDHPRNVLAGYSEVWQLSDAMADWSAVVASLDTSQAGQSAALYTDEGPQICRDHFGQLDLWWNGGHGLMSFHMDPPILFVGYRAGSFKNSRGLIFRRAVYETIFVCPAAVFRISAKFFINRCLHRIRLGRGPCSGRERANESLDRRRGTRVDSSPPGSRVPMSKLVSGPRSRGGWQRRAPRTVRRRWRDFAFRGVSEPYPPDEPAEVIERMQQGSFAHPRHPSRAVGLAPAAFVDTCAGTPWGEVRPYAPFGLMHLPGLEGADTLKAASRRGNDEQEQRGRTGLAA